MPLLYFTLQNKAYFTPQCEHEPSATKSLLAQC